MIIYGSNGYESDGKRPSFSGAVRSFMGNSGEARCHSLSFKYIENIIIDGLNKSDFGVIVSLLNVIYDNSYPVEISDLYYTDLMMTNNTDQLSRVNIANKMLTIINSAAPNLRPADISWNSSIGAFFDPVSWFFHDGNDIVSSEMFMDYGAFGDDYSGFHAYCNNYPACYLNDMNDCYMINQILGNPVIANYFNIHMKCDPANNGTPFIYSSSNWFPIPSFTNSCSLPVYYWDENGWREIEFF